MLDLSTPQGRIVAAALRLAAEGPWHSVTLADIAKSAEVSLVELRRAFGSKSEILAAFVRMVDDQVLAQAPARSPDQSPRDALFEVIMSRFDVLEPYKAGLKSISASWPADPALMRAMAASQAWMLRAAGISADGLDGQLRAGGLAALYASVARTWLDDDDPGLARTMAVLDRRLRRGERAMKMADDVKSALCGMAGVFKRPGPAERGPAGEPEPAPESPPPAAV
jgi:ubiquinone biosynthesis protein COQ9